MAIREIRVVGDRVLTKKCRPVEKMTPRISELIDDMFDTMYEANGVGLAAPRDTYDDGWIEDCVLGAFFEADAAIQAEYQFDETDHQEWIDFIVEAPKNRNLKDAFTRVAADPKTKLSRDNRFVGPALLCMKHHILPFYLAKGIAYGFLYRDESDIASIEITNYVKEHGIEKAIEVYCGLTENEWELKQLIMAQYKEAEKIR